MNQKINPEMVVLAREARGLTQSELATRIGLSQAKVSKFEQGLLPELDEETLKELESELHFPKEFFSQQNRQHLIGSYYHRKRQTCGQRILRKGDSNLNIRIFHIQELLRAAEVNEKLQNLYLDPETYGGPEEVARVARQALGVSAGPIKNLTETIENAGGVIVHQDFETRKRDGISFYQPGFPPVIFINRSMPTDRSRYTLAHELGHILMHHPSGIPRPQEEQEADCFASEFLMPEKDIRYKLGALRLEKLIDLKVEWRVSMAAIARRAYTLRKITERQYRYICMQMSKAGYRTQEPAGHLIPQEHPTLLADLIELHRSRLGYSTKELSKIFYLFPDEFEALYEPESVKKTKRLEVVK